MQTFTAEANDHESFEEKELQYWSHQLGVTVQELREAIEKVGLEVDAVAAYLKEKKQS